MNGQSSNGAPAPKASAPKAASAVPKAFTTYAAQGNREDLAPKKKRQGRIKKRQTWR